MIQGSGFPYGFSAFGFNWNLDIARSKPLKSLPSARESETSTFNAATFLEFLSGFGSSCIFVLSRARFSSLFCLLRFRSFFANVTRGWRQLSPWICGCSYYGWPITLAQHVSFIISRAALQPCHVYPRWCLIREISPAMSIYQISHAAGPIAKMNTNAEDVFNILISYDYVLTLFSANEYLRISLVPRPRRVSRNVDKWLQRYNIICLC